MRADIRVLGNTLTFNGQSYRCALGRGGIINAEQKREGDGCTPAGSWHLRECWYRADRMPAPQTALPLRPIQKEDGWCDDPAHAGYNRHFKIQNRHSDASRNPVLLTMDPGFRRDDDMKSFERLHRDDHAYDLIVPLGYNDDPVIPGRGSAIFLHLAQADYAPTEGCVALKREDLLELLSCVSVQTEIQIGLKKQL